MSETLRAYQLFCTLTSRCFFGWTTRSAAFDDDRDAETFREQFPEWSVL